MSENEPIPDLSPDPSKTILVVEDDASIRTSITVLLRQNRFQVVTASQWTEALDVLRSHTPDLIMLDLVMPEIDGVKLLQFIREQGTSTPVIIVSASIDKSARAVLNTLNISAFVAKPFRVNVLIREIWRAMEAPLFLGEAKYEEGKPVTMEELEATGAHVPRRRLRRRYNHESPTRRMLRKLRENPLMRPAAFVLAGSLCGLLYWYFAA